MIISSKTKISALIKVNPAAIEAIASINSHFEKLRNPVLRKILASRVTIADAARIGGADISVFFEKLAPLGFERENDSVSVAITPEPISTETKDKPADLPGNVVELDVREDLAIGKDPFNLIMDALEKLEQNQALLIINTFEPTPLFSIVKKRGFSHFVEEKGPELVYTYLYKTVGKSAEKVPETPLAETAISFDDLLKKYERNLQELDVRNLEMPLPMVTILETLPLLEPDQALLVDHRRVPQYLLPHVAEKAYDIVTQEITPGHVKLLIFKK